MHKMFLYGSTFQINLQVRSFQYIVLNNTMYLSWQMMQEKLIAMMHIESFSSKDPGTHDKLYMLIIVCTWYCSRFSLALEDINVNRKLCTDNISHWYTARSGTGMQGRKESLLIHTGHEEYCAENCGAAAIITWCKSQVVLSLSSQQLSE